MSEVLDHAFAVILAGGSGTRLWPMSRDGQPKQFLKLGGERTLLQNCMDRISPLIPVSRIIVVTNKEYEPMVREQLPELDPNNIVAEPEKRDTAWAMALGALVARNRDPQAVVTNLASDHVFTDYDKYRDVLRTSLEIVADKQNLMTVGVKPTGPNVNFGYIQTDSQIKEVDGQPIYKVASFKEKPELEVARQFVEAGNYYWNANMYTWHVDAILGAFAKYQPTIMQGLEKISDAIGTPNQNAAIAEVYASAEKVAIDVAISEHADNLLLIPGNFGWDDIGLWSTVYELGEKDENGQVIVQNEGDVSPVMVIDSKNNLVSTNGKLIALIGVQDLVVVDSKDVILVMPRERTAEVKNLVAQLKEKNLQEYL